MDKRFMNFMIILITIPCFLCQSRIGYSSLDITKDKNGTNWQYFTSNSTLIFDNLYISTYGYTTYFPFVLIEVIQRPNFTLILKNENTILINNIGDLIYANAFDFRGNRGNRFIIQGDGKLTIKVDNPKKESFDRSCGLTVSNCGFIIRENAKIEIIMNYPGLITGLEASLSMEGNSQLSVYIRNEKEYSYGIDCDIQLSGNITIASSVSNKDQSSNRWINPLNPIRLNNYTNVTFISNGTMKFHQDFFYYLGEDPIIINAIETLEEFKKSHILTQIDESEPIIFSNYFTVRKSENGGQLMIGISFFILLNLILLI